MTPKITERALNRIARHLDNVLDDQFGEDIKMGIMSRSDALKFQWAERQMLDRLRQGMTTQFDIEFYLHELKESTRFPSGKLGEAHRRALQWRQIQPIDMFPPEILAALKLKAR